jgi:glycosyltransferase involved in cell wall biosynthesis
MKMKRVLIICYYWPPAGGPGVQRWLKFVKYLREFGVKPTVFVPENAHYPLVDDSFQVEIPDDLEVIKFPIKEPYRFAKWISKKKTKTISSGIISEKNPSLIEKLLLYLRGNLFIPDARVGWVKPSVGYLSRYLRETKIDTVITTGPPHSLHLIGQQLKKDLGVRWIADFRDPWTTIHYYKSLRLTKASEKKHKALERGVLQSADAIVVTSPGTREEFSEITKTPITVITNGYDTSEKIKRMPDTEFTLVHVGSLLSDRNPEVLWKILSELCAENNAFKKAFRLKLVGVVGAEIEQSLSIYNLSGHLQTPGYVSHKEALQTQWNAQLLLLIEMNQPETMAIIPGKLFEYLAARRPIIALGPEGSDIKAILDDTQTGSFFLYAEEKRLKDQLLDYFEAFQNNSLNIASENIEKYSRRELTKTLANLIRSEGPN